MKPEELETIKRVCRALNNLTVRGEENMAIVIGCLSALKNLVKEGDSNGIANS